jgi:hypothetical protein
VNSSSLNSRNAGSAEPADRLDGVLIGAAAVLCASTAMAQTVRDIRGPAPVAPLAGEPPAKIVIDPPLADSLAHGRVVPP